MDWNPRFFRTVSKINYIRDNSKFGRKNSNLRNKSKPRYNSRPNSNGRSGSNARPGGKTKSGNKSFERPKEKIFNKIEMIEKKF